MPLEELHGSFVPFGGFGRSERPDIPAPSRFGVLLSRIEPILAGLEFPDHRARSH